MLAVVAFANLLANWVSVTVLQCRDIASRKRMVTKFINVMDVRVHSELYVLHTHTVNSYSGCIAAKLDSLYAMNVGFNAQPFTGCRIQ